jgi:insulysin
LLTKSDILEFANQYIHPSSSIRAKLSVHLVAQSSAAARMRADEDSTAAGEDPELPPMRAEQGVEVGTAYETPMSSAHGQVRIKASLQLSAAATPVKNLRAFEDVSL